MPKPNETPSIVDPVAKAMANQIANIENSTGKKLDEWTRIINSTGLNKHGELVNLLKEKHGLTHGNANVLVHFAKQSHAGAEGNDTDWISEQYKGKEDLKAWYDKIMTEVMQFGPDIEIAPKKAYVSLRRKKQFALIQPSTKDRLDVGLNIKGVAPSGIALPAGSWNAMCTHRIKIEGEKMINEELLEWFKKAYDQG